MRLLIVDDNVYKRIAIKRAMEELCPVQVELAVVLEEGLSKAGDVDLVITDMNYPLKAGGESVWNAGEILIRRLREKGIMVPVIICSSQNYSSQDALGCVWYNESRILSWDLRDVLKKGGLI